MHAFLCFASLSPTLVVYHLLNNAIALSKVRERNAPPAAASTCPLDMGVSPSKKF
jgi:hypothetical protein